MNSPILPLSFFRKAKRKSKGRSGCFVFGAWRGHDQHREVDRPRRSAMSLMRKIRRLRKKNEEVTATKKRRRKMLFEPLEPRVLLSADLKFAMTGAADDVKLQVKELDGVDTLQLVDMSDQSLLQSQALADT